MSLGDHGEYHLRRMCPPGNIHYFFTLYNGDYITFYDESTPSIPKYLQLYVMSLFIIRT